ncbi:uncharacterized protein LOC125777388 [Bactrocera dorsalis]|uniref:Uncharacterized protein LOC125777388 n=1 Tax=Bactrocera dorsalis TaxID=27457 RepID=A0ABM3JFV2_BACDO|nr:uncharacterized protein LOC125777388 [Bactrocera dorsalis]
MRTLLNAYKAAKDNEKQTGTSPCTVPYMREMDEIFGESCLVSNNHTLNIGTDPQKALVESSGKDSTDFQTILDDMPSTSGQSRSALSRSICRPNAVNSQEPNAANSVPNRRYRKSAKELYLKKKIEQKRKSAKVQAKFYANIKKRMQDLAENQKILIEIEQKKMKIEEEKLKILKQYFMNTN